jgi:alpha-D-ribose 1-methylphosphonate 5-triphosphate diphosphatase PhnM
VCGSDLGAQHCRDECRHHRTLPALPAFLKTSKSSLYSLRSRLPGRSRFADSKESSLSDRISYDKDNVVKIQVQQQQQQQQDQG